jgi:hypothetical protein
MAMVEQQGMRRKKAQVSKGRRERIPSFIGEEGTAPRGGVRQPLEVPPLPLHGGNPLINMSNPLFIPFLILHDIHVN